MAYIGRNPRLKSIVSEGDTLANLTAEPRVAGRLVWATDELKFYYDDGTALTVVGSGSGGGYTFNDGVIEIANSDVIIASDAATLTGLLYFRAPAAIKIVKVQVELFTLDGVSSGILSVDVKKNTTPDGTGMATIMTAEASVDFSTAADYDIGVGAIDPLLEDLAENDVIRVDVTSKPVGVTKFRITIIGGAL